MKDLVVLAADKPMETALSRALARHRSMGTRALSCTFRTHPQRDGGVRSAGHELLRLQRSTHRHALMVFDHEGSGADGNPVAELEAMLDAKLARDWDDRARCVVVAPEMDTWMWGSDNAMHQALEWRHPEGVRQYAASQGFALDSIGKPDRPKEAMEAVLRRQRLPMSASVYGDIAGRISLSRCRDPAFERLRSILRGWFPASAE